jgi:hypothetical protein
VRIPHYPHDHTPYARHAMASAHAVDAAWARLAADADAEVFVDHPRVHDAARLRLAVRCRRHAASVRRAFDTAFPPYRVMAAKMVHQ